MSELDRCIHRMNLAVANTVSMGNPSAKLEDAWDNLLAALEPIVTAQKEDQSEHS